MLSPSCQAGRAHGLAGVTEFLVGLAEETAEPAAVQAAALRVRLLADRAAGLVRLSRQPAASPLAASWCQGLSGIGQTLAYAAAAVASTARSRLRRRWPGGCGLRARW